MKTPSCRSSAFPLVVTCLLACLTAEAKADYIVNGGFNSGISGFTTSYNASGYDTGANQFSVISGNGQSWNAGFVSFTGPAGGSDPYFVADGGPSTTAAVWQQSLSNPAGIVVTTNTSSPTFYRFQAQVLWADPVDTPFVYAIPDLSFEMSIDGGAFKALTSTPDFENPGPGHWVTVYADGYFLSTPTSLGFKLRNQQTSPFGNDFAIDTISFGLTTDSPSYLAGDTAIRNAGDLANPTFVSPATVPEIDAAGMGGVFFLVSGVIGLMERRRMGRG